MHVYENCQYATWTCTDLMFDFDFQNKRQGVAILMKIYLIIADLYGITLVKDYQYWLISEIVIDKSCMGHFSRTRRSISLN